MPWKALTQNFQTFHDFQHKFQIHWIHQLCKLGSTGLYISLTCITNHISTAAFLLSSCAQYTPFYRFLGPNPALMMPRPKANTIRVKDHLCLRPSNKPAIIFKDIEIDTLLPSSATSGQGLPIKVIHTIHACVTSAVWISHMCTHAPWGRNDTQSQTRTCKLLSCTKVMHMHVHRLYCTSTDKHIYASYAKYLCQRQPCTLRQTTTTHTTHHRKMQQKLVLLNTPMTGNLVHSPPNHQH